MPPRKNARLTPVGKKIKKARTCLLYTSDAADELRSV